MELTIEHLIIMLLTVALVIGGGIYSARSVKSAEGYSLGGAVQGCLWLQAVLLVL